MAKKKELKMYTEEEIKSIRENLKKAFDIDYIPVEIKIKRLYKDKKFVPLEGDMIYVHLPYDNDKFELKRGWHRLKVTYVRSGVVFFKYIDSKHKRTEDHADLDSSFIEEAYMGTIRLKDIAVPEFNLPLVKIEKGKCPFDVEVFDNEGNKLNNIVV